MQAAAGATRQTSAAGNDSLSTDKGLSWDSPLSIYLQVKKKGHILHTDLSVFF